MNDFQALGPAIREVARDKGIAIPIRQPTLKELVALPDTLLILDDLDYIQTAHDDYVQTHAYDTRRIRQLKTQLDETIRRREWAEQRDTLQAERPAGCWCLGYGGRDTSYLPMPTGGTITDGKGEERPEIEPVELLSEYCPCQDGQARKRDDNAMRQKYRDWRGRQAVIRRFGDAGLPIEYRGLDWRSHPDHEAIRHVVRWLDDPKTERDAYHWLLLYGKSGRGKTAILAGIAAELVEAGAPVLFRAMPELISDVRATFGKGEEQEALRVLLHSVKHLFLDDIGAEVPRDWVGEFLYEVLNYRHNHHLPVYMSTNLWSDEDDLDEFAGHLGERIWGRVKRMAYPVLMNGKDLRDR